MGWGRKACGEVRLIYGQGLNKRGYIRVGQKDTGQDMHICRAWLDKSSVHVLPVNETFCSSAHLVSPDPTTKWRRSGELQLQNLRSQTRSCHNTGKSG